MSAIIRRHKARLPKLRTAPLLRPVKTSFFFFLRIIYFLYLYVCVTRRLRSLRKQSHFLNSFNVLQFHFREEILSDDQRLPDTHEGQSKAEEDFLYLREIPFFFTWSESFFPLNISPSLINDFIVYACTTHKKKKNFLSRQIHRNSEKKETFVCDHQEDFSCGLCQTFSI